MVRRLRFPFRCLLTNLGWLLATVAGGHQNPSGDVCPVVIPAKGCFQVCFNVAEPLRTSSMPQPVWFRTLHNPDGALIAPRHRIDDVALLQRLNAKARAYISLKPDYTPTIDWANDTFGDSQQIRRLVLRTWKDGTSTEEPILFDAKDCNDLTAHLIGENWAALLWSGMDGKVNDSGIILHLTWIIRHSATAPVTRVLGRCGATYDFASASNLVWASGRLWIAWVREYGDPDNRGWETMLTGFDPKSGNVTTKPLPGISNWNTSVSLATTGGWLCAAWHCTKDGSYPGKAIIVTAFEKLPPEP
jgi:hypothetical protein